MKKIAFAFLAAGLFVASCNSGGDSTTTAGDSTATTAPVGTDASGATNPNTIPGQEGTTTTPVPTGPLTSIKFAEETYDWGKIKQGETVKHVFKFTNTGTADLVISDAKGSCGCTVPAYTKEPIAPGQTGEMEVSFNSTGKEGPQQKTVTVTANTDPAQTVINIKSDVQVDGSAKK